MDHTKKPLTYEAKDRDSIYDFLYCLGGRFHLVRLRMHELHGRKGKLCQRKFDKKIFSKGNAIISFEFPFNELHILPQTKLFSDCFKFNLEERNTVWGLWSPKSSREQLMDIEEEPVAPEKTLVTPSDPRSVVSYADIDASAETSAKSPILQNTSPVRARSRSGSPPNQPTTIAPKPNNDTQQTATRPK
eukprot:CAMPEP_0168531416 /NCGR_PEP_ID=MMETSP0405-20121227/15445_1 /TAXON_ID=498012 /ORGANISM="Trichosphaerium sp, Strain Am-I-7 wt" /LENGTH=188 /DNA_ID=CAMNT_0008556235 /DNA_START=426 /DNA_END=989 /DNA_ORIENTATION=+